MEEFLLEPMAKEGRPRSTVSQSSFIPTTNAPTQRNSYEALGRQGSIFVAFGSVTILATLAFFVFLWFSSESNILWKRIVLADWAVRSVTITAVLTRWVIVAQAAFATAMLAGLILERPKVSLSDSAPLSLMRVNNGGPWDLTILLSNNRHRSTRLSLYILALLLTLLTTMLQFTSTILLTDFAIASIQSEPENLSLNFGWKTSDIDAGVGMDTTWYESLWQDRPAFYPTFAEYANATPVLKDGVHDSGVILRAYFPIISASTRSNLQSFTGVASLLGLRVICARPEYYELNITIENYTLDIQLSASTNITDEASELGSFAHDTEDWYLNCSLPLAGLAGFQAAEWTLSLCFIGITQDGSDIPIHSTSSWGEGFVVFNITGDQDAWDLASPDWNQSIHGEWAKLTNANNKSAAQLDMSICTAVYVTENQYISASSTSNRTEPSLGWNFTEQKFDTLGIRQQLGATTEQLSLDDRGLFSLEWHPTILSNIVNTTLGAVGMSVTPSWEVGHVAALTKSSIPFCQHCTFGNIGSPDGAQSAIFQDIVTQTSHPATALQAYGSLQYSMFYYMASLRFDSKASASVTSFVLRIQPTTDRGFVLYTIIIMLYLVLILFITGLFLSSKRHTMLSNSWQAIAQMVSPETESILKFADKATDAEVGDWIRKKGKDDDSFRISEDDGGIRMRRCAH